MEEDEYKKGGRVSKRKTKMLKPLSLADKFKLERMNSKRQKVIIRGRGGGGLKGGNSNPKKQSDGGGKFSNLREIKQITTINLGSGMDRTYRNNFPERVSDFFSNRGDEVEKEIRDIDRVNSNAINEIESLNRNRLIQLDKDKKELMRELNVYKSRELSNIKAPISIFEQKLEDIPSSVYVRPEIRNFEIEEELKNYNNPQVDEDLIIRERRLPTIFEEDEDLVIRTPPRNFRREHQDYFIYKQGGKELLDKAKKHEDDTNTRKLLRDNDTEYLKNRAKYFKKKFKDT